MTTAQQALDVARSQLGYKESPAGSNCTKYSSVPEFWCVDFLNWVLARVGMLSLSRRPASTPS